MALPPPETSVEAIQALARIVREGMLRSRTPRLEEVRQHYLPQLRQLYETDPPAQIPLNTGEPLTFRSSQSLKCVLREAKDGELPPTWGGRLHEEMLWPPHSGSPGQ